MNCNGTDNSSFSTKPARLAKAFTLVEMLVAILILVVGVALMVGVGSMVRKHTQTEETRNILAVLRSALKVYNPTSDKQAWPAGDGKSDSTAGLIIALRKNYDARAALEQLPLQAISTDSTGREFVMDGFGNRLRYHQTGGLAGSPLLISPGADPNDHADDINADVN